MLTDLFDDSALVKVLDFMLDMPEMDFSKADVARECKLTWISVSKVFPKLEELRVIEKTRKVNRAEMYKVVKNSLLLQALHKADLELSLIVVKQIAAEEIKKETKMEKTMAQVARAR